MTDPIAYNADGGAVEAALEALPDVDDVSVSGPAGGPYDITYLGVHANHNLYQIYAYGDALEGRDNDFEVYDFSVGLYGDGARHPEGAAVHYLHRLLAANTAGAVVVGVADVVSGPVPGASGVGQETADRAGAAAV